MVHHLAEAQPAWRTLAHGMAHPRYWLYPVILPSGLGREGETAAESATRHLVAMLREHQAAPELMRLWIELTAAGSRPDHPAHDYLVERYARIRGLAVEGYRSAPPKPSLQPEPTAILPAGTALKIDGPGLLYFDNTTQDWHMFGSVR